ncbi:LysM peptidoglycan-binding domain-containing protein [Tepidicella xavieri]|nr:LysM peptidoglycan-binding domain-containing protein [Tepidicella xavieri]
MNPLSADLHHSACVPPPVWRRVGSWALATSLLVGLAAQAQTFPNYPITAGQRSTAQQVAQAGVPLSELSPNAPERYTVKRGDTLWDISALFLQRPWRWPELWGMNMDQIRNPHLIFPGQVLVLTRVGDRAFLALEGSGDVPTVKISPRIRAESLAEAAVPPIPLNVIEPFLTESLVVDEAEHARAPRIVATQENRVFLSRGDRAYARGQYGNADALDGLALSIDPGQPQVHRIYRNATALIDPTTGETLGYEAQFIGQSRLVRSETLREIPGPNGVQLQVEPATIDITLSREEIRVGDRLLPEPLREVPVYVPRAPATAQSGQIVKAYGNALRFSGQNQIVVLNRGARDGLERGHVLAILRDTERLTDATDPSRPALQLPGERNGLMMVFRTFDRVSYALILQITDGVKVGDRFVTP